MKLLKTFHQWFFKSKYGVIYTKGEKFAAYVFTLWMFGFFIPVVYSWITSGKYTMLWCTLTLLGMSWRLMLDEGTQTRRLKELTQSQGEK